MNLAFQEMKDKFKVKIEESKKRFEAKSINDSEGEQEDPPFTNEILGASIPCKFKMPTFKIYDGSSDLVDHVEVFEGLMDF